MAIPALSTQQGLGSATVLRGRPSPVDTSQLGEAIQSGVDAYRENLKEKALELEKAKKERKKALENIESPQLQSVYYQEKGNALYSEYFGDIENIPTDELDERIINYNRALQDVKVEEATEIKTGELASKQGLAIWDEETGTYIDAADAKWRILSKKDSDVPPSDLKFVQKVEFDPDMTAKMQNIAYKSLQSQGVESPKVYEQDGQIIVENFRQLPKDVQEQIKEEFKPIARGNASTVLASMLSTDKKVAPHLATQAVDFTVPNPLGGGMKEYANFDEYLEDYSSKFLPQTRDITAKNKPSDGGGGYGAKTEDPTVQEDPVFIDGVKMGDKKRGVVNVAGGSKTVSFPNEKGVMEQGVARFYTLGDNGEKLVGIDQKVGNKTETSLIPYEQVSGDLREKYAESAFKKLADFEVPESEGFTQEQADELKQDLENLDEDWTDDPEKIKEFADKWLKGTGIKASEPSGANNKDLTLTFSDGTKEDYNTSEVEDRRKIVKAISESSKRETKTGKPTEAQIEEFKKLKGMERLQWLNDNNLSIEDFE